MTWLMENPFWIAGIGLAVVLILGIIWIKIGKRPLIYLLVAAAVIFAALFVAERLILTDREQLRLTARQTCRDVENEDRPAVLAHIHADATDIRAQAENILSRYEFQKVWITKEVEIAVNSDESPRTAEVKLIVGVIVSEKGGNATPFNVRVYVTLAMEKDSEGEWLVRSFDYDDVQKAFQK